MDYTNKKQIQIKRECVLAILAPSLIFVSGFLTYILHHDYGVFTTEVILSLTLISLTALLAGILLAIAGPTRLRAFGFALLLFIFFDIQFDLIDKIHAYLATEPDAFQKYVLLIVALFVVQLLILGLHQHIATIITTIFAVTILATIIFPIQEVSYGAQPVDATKTPVSNMPPIIHLVLDGHIGIEGIPIDIEGGPELKNLLVGFYKHWGFRLYGRAYSKHLMTYNSITHLLNGHQSTLNASLAEAIYQDGKLSWMLVQNSYFKRFSDAGYKIRVYQTDFLDFCRGFKGNIEYCYLYASSSPRQIRGLDLSVPEKTELILGSYYGDTSILRIIQRAYNYVYAILPNDTIPAWERKNYEFTSLGVPAVISHLNMDVTSDPRGRLFFAHLLLPHGPYIWDSDCQVRDDSNTWLSRRLNHKDLLSLSDAAYREAAYKYYYQQVVCTVTLLNDLLESLDKKEGLDDATIIIHGDHGSRITLADPVVPKSDYVTDRDLIDSFSTLFAIRSNKIEQGYDAQPRSIQKLFSELVLYGPVASDDAKVSVRESLLEVDIFPMPEF